MKVDEFGAFWCFSDVTIRRISYNIPNIEFKSIAGIVIYLYREFQRILIVFSYFLKILKMRQVDESELIWCFFFVFFRPHYRQFFM